jgi:hypothetical protein
MKCSNPDCNRGIGLIAYRRGWFSKRRYCSKRCRDAFVAGVSTPQRKRSVTAYFDWLFEQPVLNAQPKLVPAAIRSRSKAGKLTAPSKNWTQLSLGDQRCRIHSMKPDDLHIIITAARDSPGCTRLPRAHYRMLPGNAGSQ